MITLRRTIVCLVVCLSAATPAFAQLQREDPRKTATKHAGPIYFTPMFSIPELGVDTNVKNERNHPVSDFTVTAVPALAAWLPAGPRLMFRTSTHVDLVYYQKYVEERGISGSVSFHGEFRMARATLFGDYRHLNSRQRANFEIDARARRKEKGVLAGLEVRLLPQLSLELAAADSSVRFDADEQFLGTALHRELDRDGRSYTATLRHRLTALTTLGARVESIEDRFPLAPIRSGDSMRYSGIVEFKPRALISGTATVGFRQYRALNELTPDFTGMVADVALRYRLSGSTLVTFRVERDLQYSYEPLQPYYIVGGLGLSVRRALTGRFDVIGSWLRYQYDYKDLETGADLADVREDLTHNYGVDLGYNVRRGLRAGFGVTYWQRGSTTRLLKKYDGFRFATSLIYGL
jgi:hypothetical protein